MVTSLLFICLLSILSSVSSTGYATYHLYTPSDSLTTVACSDGANGLMTKFGYNTIAPMYPYVMAFSGATWNSPTCGQCIRLRDGGRTIYATVIDQCGPPPGNFDAHFDIAPEAFDELFGPVGRNAGHGTPEWTVVDGRFCKGNLGGSPSPPTTVRPPSSARCGTSWIAANSDCGPSCATDDDCPGAHSCFADLAPCSGNLPPVRPPTPQPPTPRPPAPQPPTTSSSTRCGTSWVAANVACGRSCTSDAGCPAGQFCFGDLAPCAGTPPPVRPPTPQPPTPRPPAPRPPTTSSTTRCGSNWMSANDNCGRSCATDDDCPGAQSCFADLSPCSGNPPPVRPPTPQPPTPRPPAPRPPAPRPVTVSTVRCGTSWTAANADCNGFACATDDDCPDNQSCFGDLATCSAPQVPPRPPTPPVPQPPTTSSSTRCGTSWIAANSGCGPSCATDDDCPGAQSCFADLSPCSGNPPPVRPPTPQPPTPRPPVPPTTGDGHVVTHSQLQRIMGNGNDLTRYLTPLNELLKQYNMDTKLRAAAFLAQVRHETAGLTIFYQPLDDGAGSLHMLPHNFRVACQDLPDIQRAFMEAFGGGCNSGSDVEAGRIISRPRLGWQTGFWWFVEGSSKMLGASRCGDLRLDCDRGREGYLQVSRCIFGFAPDRGLQQRLSYYENALNVLAEWDGGVVVPPPRPTNGPASPTRCGRDWNAANGQCGKSCSTDSDCGAGESCFADLNTLPCMSFAEDSTSLGEEESDSTAQQQQQEDTNVDEFQVQMNDGAIPSWGIGLIVLGCFVVVLLVALIVVLLKK